jgi:hypothetical protein
MIESAQSIDSPAAKKPLSNSARRINILAKANYAASYLEVGVQRGVTFFDVAIPNKVAVDPMFKFDLSAHQAAGVEFHPVTSDRFFAELPLSRKFDLIFLDGLHTFEQTLRDFCNSLSHSHEKTIWVIDDTVPSDIYSAHKVQASAVGRRVAETKNKKALAWHGDVYKTVVAIHDFFPSFNYCTVNTVGHKQTFVWMEKQARAPLFNDLEAISRMDYFGFLAHFDTLRPLPEAEAIAKVCTQFAAGR